MHLKELFGARRVNHRVMLAASQSVCNDRNCRMVRERYAIGCIPTAAAIQLHTSNWEQQADRVHAKSTVPIIVAVLLSFRDEIRHYDHAGADALGNPLISKSASLNGVLLSNIHSGVRGKEGEGSYVTFITGVGRGTNGPNSGLTSCRVYALLLLVTPAAYRLQAGAFFVCDAALTRVSRIVLRLFQATHDKYMSRDNARDPVSIPASSPFLNFTTVRRSGRRVRRYAPGLHRT